MFAGRCQPPRTVSAHGQDLIKIYSMKERMNEAAQEKAQCCWLGSLGADAKMELGV